jgi:AAA domain
MPARSRGRTAPRSGLPAQIQPIGARKNIAMLVYGHPGCGKTVLAATSPRCLIVRPPTDHTVGVPLDSKAQEWVVRDWNDITDVANYFRHDEGSEHFDWVWLDSISAFQDFGLDAIWEELVAANPHRKNTQLDRLEYWKNMSRLTEWVRGMVSLDTVNVGVTAWAFKDEDENGRPLWMPWVQGRAMPQKICGYMNLVGRLAVLARQKDGEGYKKGDQYRVMYTDLTDKYYAKDQYLGAFKGKMLHPSMPKIIKVIDQVNAERELSSGTQPNGSRPAKVSRRPGIARATNSPQRTEG